MLVNLCSGSLVMVPLARVMWWYVIENRGEMSLSLTVCDMWHDTLWAHHTPRQAPCHETVVTWYHHIIFRNLDGRRCLENNKTSRNETIISTGGQAGEEWDCIWLWTRGDVWRVRSVTCDNCQSPGPALRPRTDMWHMWQWRGDTWHMASCNTDHHLIRSENTLNGNMLRYLNPLTPHWASAPNKTISDVSSGWSYHRLKGDNWDHNPFPALWKPQCLRAGARLIPVLCLSELCPWSQIWHGVSDKWGPRDSLCQNGQSPVIDGGVGSQWVSGRQRGEELSPLCHDMSHSHNQLSRVEWKVYNSIQISKRRCDRWLRPPRGDMSYVLSFRISGCQSCDYMTRPTPSRPSQWISPGKK